MMRVSIGFFPKTLTYALCNMTQPNSQDTDLMLQSLLGIKLATTFFTDEGLVVLTVFFLLVTAFTPTRTMNFQ